MPRLTPLFLVTLLALAATAARAFEVVAVLRSLDTEARIAQVTAGGRDRRVPVAADCRFLDRDGKALAQGIRSPELKPGVEVTLTVEPVDGTPTIRALRLGRAPAAPPRPDTAGLKPLGELGRGMYQGFQGGFYPNGAVTRPAAHEAAGVALARQVQPRDAEGRPSPEGRIVLLTIGMSNTSQSTQGFQPLFTAEPQRNPRVVLVNGAQGGMTAARIQDPATPSGMQYWSTVESRVRQAGVTAAQVQAVWIKQANGGPREGFPAYARQLESELARIVQLLPERFPNLKLAYLSSRTYGGWATTQLNPEPYAYESGFSVKWLIERQIQGEAALNFDPTRGPVKAPWLSWGPYLWANGATPRADGFAWEQADFAQDGTHQSPAGQRKVGKLLLEFFRDDSTTRPWFRR
jgi:hypothetical protein